MSALLNVFDDIMHLMSSGNTVDMVYLDFVKADHGVLLHNIHFVRLQGDISHVSPVHSDVPQGTVLGPLLFIILMGDINCSISSSSIVGFADDTRLYHGISNVDDYSFLQNDLNSVYDWATCNNMSFNAQKSNIYVVVLILHHLLKYTPDLVLISLTTLETFLIAILN